MCLAGATAWSSALSPEPLPSTAATYRYGANLGGDEADMFSVPIATVLPAGAGAGFSLALSPEDPVLELTLAVGASGLRFGRELLRLGSGRPVVFELMPGTLFITTLGLVLRVAKSTTSKVQCGLRR